MKKYLMLMAVAAIALTSCGKDDAKDEPNDVEKAAQLVVEIQKAIEDDDYKKADNLEKELQEIIDDNKDNKDFEMEVKEAIIKMSDKE